jgi:glutamyl-Q tRNA(Asp) synthetase
VITRFAPSPTGYLHLGNAASALWCWRNAEEAGGTCLLRIEDIDLSRCRAEYETALYEDLRWLGLSWPEPVRRQSGHMADYAAVLARLRSDGLAYPCFCSRKDIAAAASAPHGPDGPLYPGTCRSLSEAERAERIAKGLPHAFRLDCAEAMRRAGPLSFSDRDRGEIEARPDLLLGDAVLGRKDVPTSYHLSVVSDDALQGVTLVTRGADLLDAAHLHVLLQAVLGLPKPGYHHHPLVMDETGKRLAKRDRPHSLAQLREAGETPENIRRHLGF